MELWKAVVEVRVCSIYQSDVCGEGAESLSLTYSDCIHHSGYLDEPPSNNERRNRKMVLESGTHKDHSDHIEHYCDITRPTRFCHPHCTSCNKEQIVLTIDDFQT